MKNQIENFVATLIVGTFIMGFAYIGTVEAQTATPQPRGNGAVAPPGGALPVQPHTANAALAATPSSGVANPPTANTALAATQNNSLTPVNPLTQSPQYQTPNANSPQNATPSTGQVPAQGATTNGAGQSISQ